MTFNELRQPLTPLEKVYQQFYINLTARYLLPQVKLLGDNFMQKFNNTNWSAFGLSDIKYPKYTEYDNKLFMLAHTDNDLSYWFDNYEHYLYKDGETNKMMFIVDLPINNRNAFLEGSYSNLYNQSTINKIILETIVKNNIEYTTEAWNVLNKTPEGLENFKRKIKEDFDVQENNQYSEYEYPPMMEKEIFNYI